MKRGACVISIDYEYAWGVVDRNLTENDLVRIRKETEITEQLIALFEKHAIPATWAIVGKLLEEHPEKDSAWTDTHSLIPRIKNSSAGHEIGSHSYGHIMYDEDTEAVLLDIENARLAHQRNELPFHSFIFPRNREGHHAFLREKGISVFRGKSRLWYHILPYRLWALGRGVDYWLPTAHMVLPTLHESGLINIADSLLLVSRKGIQKLLPASQVVRKFRWGVKKAIDKKEIFHVWFHPSNFAYDTATQLEIFDRMLGYLAERRDSGDIDVVTMWEIANQNTRLQQKFNKVDEEVWRERVGPRSKFVTKEWENALVEAFPYIRFHYYVYNDKFAVRLVQIENRITTVPFSDGGDVFALSEAPLSLKAFRADAVAHFGNRMTLRVHEHNCSVIDAEGAKDDIVDFRIRLPQFDVKSLRKTLRHIVTEDLPEGVVIRKVQDDKDVRAAYKLYLKTMRTARALALPYDVFHRELSQDAFIFELQGVPRGVSVFVTSASSVDYFMSATDEEGRAHNAAHHLLMHAIDLFSKQGKENLFLGGTNTGSTLRIFKEGWRGEPRTLYTIESESVHESARRSPLRMLWRFIPLSILPKAGKLAGKYVF